MERFPRANKNYLPSNKIIKDLVIYGSNLASTVGYPYYTVIVRHMVNIPNRVISNKKYELESMLIGILISDGWLDINKSGNARFFFKQSFDKINYLLFVFNKFSHFCSNYPQIQKTKLNGRIFVRQAVSVYFATRALPCFTYYYNIFYQKHIKIVPLDLYNLLTYEALAHWIMCDGTRSHGSIILQTQSFTIKEVVFIINILMYKFNLNCNIHMQRNQPTIYISSKSVQNLLPNILPYFCPTMLYKFS